MIVKSPIVFTAEQTYNGKWRLTHLGADCGMYDTPKEVEAAIERILNPKIMNYDENGTLIK